MDEVDEYLYGDEDGQDGPIAVVTTEANFEAERPKPVADSTEEPVEEDAPYEPPDEPYEPPGFEEDQPTVESFTGDTMAGEGSSLQIGNEEEEEEEEEEDSDEDLDIVVAAPTTPAPKPVIERRNSLVLNNTPATNKTQQPKPATPTTTSPYTFITPIPRQDGTVAPPSLPAVITKSAIDIDAVAQVDEKEIYDLDLEQIEDKPWRRPGADITDYFNYGFNEQTWKAYVAKQKRLREEQNVVKQIHEQSYEPNAQDVDLGPDVQMLGGQFMPGAKYQRIQQRPVFNRPGPQTVIPLKRMRDQDEAVIPLGGEGDDGQGIPEDVVAERMRDGFPPEELGPAFHGGPPPPMGMYGGPDMFGPMPPFMPPDMPGFDPYRRPPPGPPMRPGMMRPGPGMPPPMRGDRQFYPMDEPGMPGPFPRDGPPHRGGPPFERGPPHGREEFPPFSEPGRGHDRRGGREPEERDGTPNRKRARVDEDYHRDY
ncbi:cleavage polyadenylation factor subunit fip1 [Rhizophlyctis rosea]|nr:cleavage polyadenylation factor subunit fip1 [Rhizophlyctis rosea]